MIASDLCIPLKILIIPPVYEVYRAYIVLPFPYGCFCKVFFRQRFLRNYLT